MALVNSNIDEGDGLIKERWEAGARGVEFCCRETGTMGGEGMGGDGMGS